MRGTAEGGLWVTSGHEGLQEGEGWEGAGQGQLARPAGLGLRGPAAGGQYRPFDFPLPGPAQGLPSRVSPLHRPVSTSPCSGPQTFTPAPPRHFPIPSSFCSPICPSLTPPKSLTAGMYPLLNVHLHLAQGLSDIFYHDCRI